MPSPQILIDRNVDISINSQELLEYLQWHVTSGHLAFMQMPADSSTANSELEHGDGYRRMSIAIANVPTSNWQMIGYIADYDGYVDVMMGRELYENGPTELVRIDIYGPADLNVEPLQMLGLTHTPVYEVVGLSNLWSDWRKEE